jgi:hypothetical protein
VDVLAVMVRDASDAEKFRIGSQPDFPSLERLHCREESDKARAAVARLIEAAKSVRSAEAAFKEWASTADQDAPAPHALLALNVNAKRNLFDALAGVRGES